MNRHPTREVINNIAVIGSCGAAGSKTFATGLALHLLQHVQTHLVDVEPASGLDMALGIEQTLGIRWSDLEGSRGRIDVLQLLSLMPQYAGLSTLTNSHHNAVPIDDLAVQSYLQSCRDAQNFSVTHVDARGLPIFQKHLDAIAVVSPLTAVGVVRTMAIKQLAYPTPVFVVANSAGPMEVTPELFRKTTGLNPIAFLPFVKAIQRSSQLGQGPFSGPQHKYKKYFEVTAKVAAYMLSSSSSSFSTAQESARLASLA